MKALSIKQPYANQILYTGKDVEVRSWKTSLREYFAVHASKEVSDNFVSVSRENLILRGKKPFVPPTNVYLPNDFKKRNIVFGAIIGIVKIVDCVEKYNSPHFMEGPFGFILEDPHPLPIPIEIKGALNFWNVPDEIEKQIRKQLRGKIEF